MTAPARLPEPDHCFLDGQTRGSRAEPVAAPPDTACVPQTSASQDRAQPSAVAGRLGRRDGGFAEAWRVLLRELARPVDFAGVSAASSARS